MKKKINIIIVSVIFSIILWISISLSNNYFATIDVKLKVINLPEGYTTGSNLPDKISIKLKGKGWKLSAANIGSKTDFYVSARKDSGLVRLNLYNSVIENPWLSSDVELISIYPDTVSFYVEKIIRKKLKIIPNITVNYKAGYGLASPVYISPESVFVYGPVSILSKNPQVLTENNIYSNLDDKVVEKIGLLEQQGIKFGNNDVSLYLNVQRIVEKNFDDIPVVVKDIPKDRDVILLPNKVSVGVRGGIDNLGKISSEEFNFYVNYRDVVLDTLGSIHPKYQIPENLNLIYIKPENLNYIIKKF